MPETSATKDPSSSLPVPHTVYIDVARFVNGRSNSPVAMSSLGTLLLASLLTVLQLVLSTDAKGGGKGGGSKSSKKGSKSKSKPIELKENEKCYNEQYAILFLFASSLSSPLCT